MKTRFSVPLALFIVLAVFFSSFAANMAGKSATFLEVRYVPGVGVVLLFETTGLTKSDLRGASIFVHSSSYNLSCNFKDGNKKDETRIVRCVAPGGLTEWAGEMFSGHFAGIHFSGIMPAKKVPAEQSGCPAGQELWISWQAYDGEDPYQDSAPAWQFHEIAPYIGEYEILGQFCCPIEKPN
jgi:hypothetical protein